MRCEYDITKNNLSPLQQDRSKSSLVLRFLIFPIVTGIAFLMFACGASESGKNASKTQDAKQEEKQPAKSKKNKNKSNNSGDDNQSSKTSAADDAELPQLNNVGGFMGLDPEIVNMFVSGKFDLTKLSPKQLAQVQAFIEKSGGFNAMMQGMAGGGMPMGGFPQGNNWPGQPTSTSGSVSTGTSPATSTAIQTSTAPQTATTTQSAFAGGQTPVMCTKSCPATCSDGSVIQCDVSGMMNH